MGIFDFLKKKGAPTEPQRDTERPQYRVSNAQKQICERLGLTVEPGMFQCDVDDLIKEALKDPAKRAIEDEHWRKFAEEEERQNREDFGDAIVDEYNKWKPMAFSDGHWLVVVKRGKSRLADVVQIGEVDFSNDGKVWASIAMTLPKVTRYDGDFGFVNWEKDITVKSTQVLHIEPVDPSVQPIDEAATYRTLKAKVEAIAAAI